ncbi:pilus assembly FimT family protein [Anaeromyxobacter diazotrophicus]|uniref:Prepilin-type N-terminal cleavage/methylation domain-containing protein n=1 Tax=Anaeromyxobacter diazotrophicus TaxID=2590199 RepID=A0A7I9VHD2_9BACT|nr:prepilin-type N-terminal cleavage/methylation domain-containing protein [Anaeromyxobacter diazotrophicus]GEJ55659.1 hypothetical protein AMYX_04000 [Anaeromyxobacter diazotrophicus]
MPATPRRQRGFTLIEVAVVLAIAAAMVTMGYPLVHRTRPRVELAGLGTQLHALVHRARQEALARGKDVAVIFYPAATTSSGTGRILVIADEAGGFMGGAAPAGNLDYCTTLPNLHGDTLDAIDLPRGVTLSAPARAQAFPFPYNLAPAPANGCSFCTGTVPSGGGARGALRFDARGRAAFFADCGVASALPNGGSVALTNSELGGSRVLTVLPSGAIRTFSVE